MSTYQLDLCKQCKLRKFNMQVGLVCGITMVKPAFEGVCNDYQADVRSMPLVEKKKVYDKTKGCHASYGKRFGNYFIDMISYYLMAFFLGIVLGILKLLTNMDISWLDNLEDGPAVLIFFIYFMVYYIFFEAVLSATPGKLITGTRVVMRDGSRPTLSAVIGRTFSRLVPLEGLSVFFGDGVAWHDEWTNTRVVDNKKWKARQEEIYLREIMHSQDEDSAKTEEES